MGKDICGWVEVRRQFQGVKPPYDVCWYSIINVGSLITRNYDMFDSLFGAAFSYTRFTPIAANRGLPQDISEQASDDYLTWDCVMGETWISWAEILSIDWNEEALDGRPHEYALDANAELVYVRKSEPEPNVVIVEGNTWQVGAAVFKVEKISRGAALRRDWQLLFRLMEDLAAEYGVEAVRLVTWFDY